MSRRALRPGDVLVGAAVVSLFFFLPTLRERPAEKALMVTADGIVKSLPLTPDRELSIHGPLGDSIVEVRGGKARFKDSPCPGRQCVRAGWVDGGGGAAVCAPNRVAVEVAGKNGGVDAVSH